jgi:hypothetical protein
MNKIVKVLDWDGNYITDAFIDGLEYVKGSKGYFTSLVLLTLKGEKLYGWQFMIAPYTLLLEGGTNASF